MDAAQETGFMSKVTNWIEEHIVPGVVKFTQNKYVDGIRQGFLDTIPLMLIGSIFLVIALFPVEGWSDVLGSFFDKLWVMYTFTFGVLAVATTYTISYHIAKNLNMDPILPAMFSILGFLMLSPPTEGGLPIGNLGGTGLFSSIIVAVLAPTLLKFMYDKNITFRMPKEVPEGIASVFTSIVPGFVFMTLIWVIRIILNFDVNSWIISLLSPLVRAGDSLWVLLVEAFINRAAWIFGIHGYTVVQSVAMPFWQMALEENIQAAAAGLPIPHVGTSTFFDGLAIWSGSLTWPVIVIMLFSKLRSWRAIARLNAPVGIFCIWEPVVFGLPIILNPILAIPMILTSLWGVVVAYYAVIWGLVTTPYVMIPMITPPILSGFLSTGGDWRSIPVSIIVLVGAGLIWYPFLKAYERMRAKENPGDVIQD